MPPLDEAGRAMADQCVAEVAQHYGVTVERIFCKRRLKGIVEARQHAYFTVRRLTGWSYTQCGEYFGRNHATILHGVRQHYARNGMYYEERKYERKNDTSN